MKKSSAALAILAVAAAACGKPARVSPLAPWAGTWEGRIVTPGTDDVGVPWTWKQSADSTGTLVVGRDGIEVPTKILSASADSVVVQLSNAVRIPLIDASDVGMRFVGHLHADSLTGRVLAISPIGSLQRGNVQAKRVTQTASRR